ISASSTAPAAWSCRASRCPKTPRTKTASFSAISCATRWGGNSKRSARAATAAFTRSRAITTSTWRRLKPSSLLILARVQREELGVFAVPPHQLFVGAGLDDFSAREHDDLVRIAHGREAMGHEDQRFFGVVFFEIVEDLRLRLGIDRAG